MENLFDDEEEEIGTKKKYDHDIPLAFDEREENNRNREEIEEPRIKKKLREKERKIEEEKEERGDFIEANLFKEKKEEKEEKCKTGITT